MASLLGGSVGGASIMQQAQQVEAGPMNFMESMSSLNPMMSMGNQATPQQQKDFRTLEQSLVAHCANQCLKRERTFHKDSEMCQAKCYDIAFIYTRVGLNEINQFAYENNIRT